jgi:hypothetical protein
MGYTTDFEQFSKVIDNPNEQQLQTIRDLLEHIDSLKGEEKIDSLIGFITPLMKAAYQAGYVGASNNV